MPVCSNTVDVLKNGCTLKNVALLYDTGRLHFSLDYDGHTNGDRSDAAGQLGTGKLFRDGRADQYMVKVKFTGGSYGSFSQRIVFDFGRRPVASRMVAVDLYSDDHSHEMAYDLRNTILHHR